MEDNFSLDVKKSMEDNFNLKIKSGIDDNFISQIKNGKMTKFQFLIVFICILIQGLDGFDVLVVSYTANALTASWNLDPTQVGFLLSSGLAGMGLGALLIAPFGDKYGRKPIILLCMAILTLGMLMSAYSQNIYELAFLRLFTGLGVGAVLANVNILVLEYSSNKRKALCISLLTLGYPIGATLGGFFSVYLLKVSGWSAVYLFGASLSFILFFLVYFFIPESLEFLVDKKPKHALDKINKILFKLNMTKISEIPATKENKNKSKNNLFVLFNSQQRKSTLVVCVLYFFVMMTSYFLLSWTPKILFELGLDQSKSIYGSLLMNIGGLFGCLIYGFIAHKFGVKKVSTIFMLGLFSVTMIFANLPRDVIFLFTGITIVGFFLHTSINTLYLIAPQAFPTSIRSTGTGFAMSIGRLGAVVGPLLAGILMSMHITTNLHFLILSIPMIIAAFALKFLDMSKNDKS